MWIEVTHTIALRLQEQKPIADRSYVTIEDTGKSILSDMWSQQTSLEKLFTFMLLAER